MNMRQSENEKKPPPGMTRQRLLEEGGLERSAQESLYGRRSGALPDDQFGLEGRQLLDPLFVD